MVTLQEGVGLNLDYFDFFYFSVNAFCREAQTIVVTFLRPTN